MADPSSILGASTRPKRKLGFYPISQRTGRPGKRRVSLRGRSSNERHKLKYKIVKLDIPLWRPGRRIFKYKIIRLSDNQDVFFFEDKETAEDTLNKLN